MARSDPNPIPAEAIEAILRIPPEALLPLLPFLGGLANERPRPLTPATVRRACDRWWLLKRFAELRASPEHCRDSERESLIDS